MKALNEITNGRELEHQRALLLRQLRRQERSIDKDFQQINKSWHRWKQVGSTISNIALAFMPKINVVSTGLGLFRHLWKKKK